MAYFFKDGTPSSCPTSQEEAKRLKKKMYSTRTQCTVCNHANVRYTTTGDCVHCRRLAALDFFNFAIGASYIDMDDYGALAIMFRQGENPISHDYRDELEALKLLVAPDGGNATPHREQANPLWVSSQACETHGHYGIREISGECYFCLKRKLAPNPRKAAIAAEALTFNVVKPCTVCGSMERRTSSGRCTGCFPIVYDGPRPRNIAKRAGEPTYISDTPCRSCHTLSERRTSDAMCRICYPPNREVSPRQQALKAGETTYIPTEPCKACGGSHPRTVANGICQGCNPPPPPRSTPRKDAIAEGKLSYTPETPCKVCHTYSLRSVINGRCHKCHPPRTEDTRRTPDSRMMDAAPDMILTRKDAITLGIGVYRTGKPCKHKHRGFRYVSTKGCINCLRGTL
jgi:hypothetical protein